MSTELKYNLTLLPASPLPFNRFGLWSVLAIVAVLFSPGWISGALLSSAVALVLVVQPIRRSETRCTIIVSESGEWQQLDGPADETSGSWQLNSKSVQLPFGLYLSLREQRSKAIKHRWVFPCQTDDISYRRLSRIVFRLGIS